MAKHQEFQRSGSQGFAVIFYVSCISSFRACSRGQPRYVLTVDAARQPIAVGKDLKPALRQQFRGRQVAGHPVNAANRDEQLSGKQLANSATYSITGSADTPRIASPGYNITRCMLRARSSTFPFIRLPKGRLKSSAANARRRQGARQRRPGPQNDLRERGIPLSAAFRVKLAEHGPVHQPVQQVIRR